MKYFAKALLAILFSLTIGFVPSYAQDCDPYFPMEKGAYREMKSYDKKEKLTGTVKQRVVDIEDIDGGKKITVEVQSYDQKDELLFFDDLTMTCQGGKFTVDMKNYLNYEMMKGLEGIQVNIDATDLAMPTELEPGMELPDGHIHVLASNMGIPMINMEVTIYDRKVEGQEQVTRPAGTFDCYKISYMTEVKTFGKYVLRSVEWTAKDIGTVRSESYDKKDNLSGYTVLTELK